MFDIFYFKNRSTTVHFGTQVSTIEDAQQQSRTRYLWILHPDNDYSDFDFSWEPPPWESNQIHVWPSQHQQHGGTILINKQGAEHTNYDHSVVLRTNTAPRIHVKHNPNSEDQGNLSTRYISNYLSTLQRVLRKVDWQYCWITSDICDYTHFDFTWHPSEWQQDYLHVFPSNEQKFGDTFFINIPEFLKQTENLELLEYYPKLNFVDHVTVTRNIKNYVHYSNDSLVDAVWNHEFTEPVHCFYKHNLPESVPTISLWQPRLKKLTPLSSGAEIALVPREAKNYLKTQLYDYPWIDKTYQHSHSSTPCDVIFISNGEPMAELNWFKLQANCPRAKRSDGVTGRELAYKTAAKLSDTDWFYAVFAKTEVLGDFKFDFQPDRLQQPKHYIFHSRNPLNGLEYGAMNINLYNKQLVLDTDPGLDFTLSQLHDVVPVCASISRFNTDPWITWRSAFREVLKLKLEVDQGAGPEIQHRLETWCTVAKGDNAEYCLQGSNDALEYYESVNGEYEHLKLSFDWDWLEDFYYKKYNKKIWLEFV